MIRKVTIKYIINILSIVFLPLMIQANPDGFSENQIKAAYLYNFAKFAEWPATSFNTPNTPIILCIFGDSPFDHALDKIENKSVRGRPLYIRYCRNIEDIKGCHMLFIGSSTKPDLENILSEIKNEPILTVSDMSDSNSTRGIINFIRVGNKIQFEVNLKAAENASIKISSRMLKIAKLVQ